MNADYLNSIGNTKSKSKFQNDVGFNKFRNYEFSKTMFLENL
jgi:hypothetical protein